MWRITFDIRPTFDVKKGETFIQVTMKHITYCNLYMDKHGQHLQKQMDIKERFAIINWLSVFSL